MKKLSSKMVKDIIDKYNNGESVVDIAIEYNISKTAVYNHIKNNPNAIKKTNYTNLPDTTIDNIIKDYKSGIKVIDLAKKYNVSKVTIYSHIRELSKKKKINFLKIL
jgi:Mor family transcriptional regulator